MNKRTDAVELFGCAISGVLLIALFFGLAFGGTFLITWGLQYALNGLFGLELPYWPLFVGVMVLGAIFGGSRKKTG